MNPRLATALSTAALLTIAAQDGIGGTYTIRSAAGVFLGVSADQRPMTPWGLTADAMWKVTPEWSVGVGAHGILAGTYAFSYRTFTGEALSKEDQRDLGASLLARGSTRIGLAAPFLSIGLGERALIHRQKFDTGRSASSTQHVADASVGVGIRGTAGLTPVFEARWHRLFGNPYPLGPEREATNLLMVSAGLSFGP